MLDKQEILKKLGYHESSLAYAVAEVFLISKYIEIVQNKMLNAVNDEYSRLDTEKDGLEEKKNQTDPTLTEQALENLDAEIAEIQKKLIALKELENGITQLLVANLSLALKDIIPDSSQILDPTATKKSIDYLPELIKKFHSRKSDSTEYGFKPDVLRLLEEKKSILGAERHGLLATLRHILGGVLSALGFGIPLIFSSFRQLMFSTETERKLNTLTAPIDEEIAKGKFSLSKQHVTENSAWKTSMDETELNNLFDQAEQQQKLIYTILKSKANGNESLQPLIRQLDKFNLETASSNSDLDINLESAISLLKLQITKLDHGFAANLDSLDTATNQSRQRLARLFKFEAFINQHAAEIVPRVPAPK